MKNTGCTRVAGFTLLELMMTCVVAVVVAFIALPSYHTIIRNARLTTQIYDFDAALNLARSEAVKRGYAVTLCPSTDRATCGDGTLWGQGWIVFVDVNNNQTVDNADSREVVLRAGPALVSGYTLRGSSTTTLASYVTMNPKGQVSASGQFVLCENDAINPSRAILVNAVGRITFAQDNNGVPIDANGNPITTCSPA